MFQRLVVLAKGSNVSFEDCKGHELFIDPPALSESTSLIQKVFNPPSATAIADFVKIKSNAAVICEETENVVLDDDILLHLIPWEKNTWYQDIALTYTNCVISNIMSASVVFDGYPETPTAIKDNTYTRRLGKGISPRIKFEPDMLFQGKKDVFLSNTANEQRIINRLNLLYRLN